MGAQKAQHTTSFDCCGVWAGANVQDPLKQYSAITSTVFSECSRLGAVANLSCGLEILGALESRKMAYAPDHAAQV